ncbi:hypothetical protein E2C01_088982 [Portunus trituberculatus]|uniref:Uncharacterized protein n=1 Tax=Portunus trituberculatus TaxID=210409 RepID=A0A5B7JGW8_PORTR|nr:hypothetical protein [Portunus trituberculatus]
MVRGSRTAVPSTPSSAGPLPPPRRSWRSWYRGHLRYFMIPCQGIRLQWCHLLLPLPSPWSLCLLTYMSSSRGFWPISPLLLLCRMPSPQLLLWRRTLTLLHHFPSLVRRLSHTGWIHPLSRTPPPFGGEVGAEVLPESWAPVPPDWQMSQVAGQPSYSAEMGPPWGGGSSAWLGGVLGDVVPLSSSILAFPSSLSSGPAYSYLAITDCGRALALPLGPLFVCGPVSAFPFLRG